MTKRFAVIGAGAGGLCVAKNLMLRGVDVTVFEVGSHVGGLWVYDNDSGLSPAYRSLHINSEAKVSSYIDFPFRKDVPLYPDHREMSVYFREYADHFGLTPRIRFKSRVTAIEPQGDGFRVALEGGAAERFDGVVVANGHQSIPRHPPGMEAFSGEYIHAHAYRVPEPYSGKRVLVIGPGNSGVDIAADICSVTEHTALCARSPVLIMPRMMFGVPNSRILMKLERPWLPWRTRVWIRTALTRMFHGTMEQWGLRTPKTRTHPISHPTLISHMAWGRVVAKPGIRSIEGERVTFVDGTADRFDSIIAATGYDMSFPFLSAAIAPNRGMKLDLYNRVVHPKVPGLYFIGLFDASGGANIRMMDDQAEYIAAAVAGELKLPSAEEMTKAVQADHAWAAKHFPDSPRYGLELDPRRYRKALARDYAASGIKRDPDPRAPATERAPPPAYVLAARHV